MSTLSGQSGDRLVGSIEADPDTPPDPTQPGCLNFGLIIPPPTQDPPTRTTPAAGDGGDPAWAKGEMTRNVASSS
ncbi:hypothetical protein [Laspinema palackyanum]|uniref:hypothetical protein n=1 Tax=Laspinema palackyanum TaxID=3231601 RepID=UPI00345D8BEE|nr:hypothetical protein [Laspinema sp. D2c]